MARGLIFINNSRRRCRGGACCRGLFWFWAFAILAALGPIDVLLAQAPATGTITGHVRGPGGVSIPGVTVQLVELQTGERKETWTDEAGNYVLTGLKPGTYRLETSLVGFRSDVREPVPVAPGSVLKVNAAMVMATPAGREPAVAANRMPGSAATTGNNPGLAAQTQGRMAVQGTGGIAAASINGEGGSNGLRFSEGTGGRAGADSAAGQTDQGGAEENLSASAANSFLLSGSGGVDASTPMGTGRGRMSMMREGMGPGGGPGGAPGGGPGFELGGGGGGFGGGGFGGGGFGGGGFGGGGFGGGGGAGGGPDWARQRARVNRIRGNVSLRFTDSALDARPYPLNSSASPRLPSHNEQIGVSLGGPLTIPKIYNDGNKTSFFVNWNIQRGISPFDSYSTVPTAAERLGDFSQAAITAGPLAGTVPIVYNPLSNPSGPRQPFGGNQIPPDMINSAAAGLLKFIPLPNLPGQFENFHLQEALPTASGRLMLRIGHQLSPHDSLNGMYFFNSSRSN